MKKLLMLGALSFILTTTSAFASCGCKVKKVECDPCHQPKVTCMQTCPQYDHNYRAQCCQKKSFLKRIWGGTKTAYDNSFGAIYDTVVYPFR